MTDARLLQGLGIQVEGYLADYQGLFALWLVKAKQLDNPYWGTDIGTLWLSINELGERMQSFYEILQGLREQAFPKFHEVEREYFAVLFAYFGCIHACCACLEDITRAQYEENKEPDQLTPEERQVLFDASDEIERVCGNIGRIFRVHQNWLRYKIEQEDIVIEEWGEEIVKLHDIAEPHPSTAASLARQLLTHSPVSHTVIALRKYTPNVYWPKFGLMDEEMSNAT